MMMVFGTVSDSRWSRRGRSRWDFFPFMYNIDKRCNSRIPDR